MRIAIIDLGTNTFNLLIRDLPNNAILYNDKIAVKLGEGGINTGTIAAPAFERGIQALIDHKKTIEQWQVDETYAFATSAIRSANNGKDFVSAARQKTGIIVNVINGQQEAELIYLGVKQAMDIGANTSLIMDIGGGSTEFILAGSEGLIWKNSYDIGASRLLEKFRPSDPISPEEIAQIQKFLQVMLSDLFEQVSRHPTNTLIGSSGSFETLAAMISFADPNSSYQSGLNAYTFDLDRYKAMARLMIESTIEQRINTPGMIPMRADMMGIVCIQINIVLEALNIQTLKLSTYALKEGVFYSLKENENTWLKSSL